METNNLSKLTAALIKMQATMPSAKKDSKNYNKGTYANLDSVFTAIRDPLAANGLAVTQTMHLIDNGRTVLTTRLLHASGESIDSQMLLPENKDFQELGKAITYYKRYSLCALLAVSTEDDDGQSNCDKIRKDVKKAESKPVTLPSIGELDAESVKEELAPFPELRARIQALVDTTYGGNWALITKTLRATIQGELDKARAAAKSEGVNHG